MLGSQANGTGYDGWHSLSLINFGFQRVIPELFLSAAQGLTLGAQLLSRLKRLDLGILLNCRLSPHRSLSTRIA